MIGAGPGLPGFAPPPPEGFVLRRSFLGREEHDALLERVKALPFGAYVMHGVAARRRVALFGAEYGGGRSQVARLGAEIPAFLLPLRDRCAALAGREPSRFPEALATWYPPGAPIGWHRDAPQFGTVVGVSLGGGCRFRMRRARPGGGWETWEAWLEPGDAYVMAGPSRTAWQHHIPPVPADRWSVTFRTLRAARRPRAAP